MDVRNKPQMGFGHITLISIYHPEAAKMVRELRNAAKQKNGTVEVACDTFRAEFGKEFAVATKEDMPIVKALKQTKLHLAKIKNESFEDNLDRLLIKSRTQKTEKTINGLKNLIADNVSVRIIRNQK